MTDLKQQIRNAAVFDEKATQKWIDKYDEYDLPSPFIAMKHQHAQNKWAFEALLIAVEALSKANGALKNVENLSRQYTVLRGFHPFEKELEQIAALVPKGEN